MDLKMFVKGELIDSRPINILGLNFRGLITSLKIELEETHEEIIDLSNEEPQFFVDHIPSSMNSNRFLYD